MSLTFLSFPAPGPLPVARIIRRMQRLQVADAGQISAVDRRERAGLLAEAVIQLDPGLPSFPCQFVDSIFMAGEEALT